MQIKNTNELNEMLTKLICDLENGDATYERARHLVRIAQGINYNNRNAIKYKKLTRHSRKIKFFEPLD